MKISIITNDFSKSSFHRPYTLANALKNKYEVEIVGPIFGNKVYEPCSLPIVKYKLIKGHWFPLFFKSIKELLEKIGGDIIYASKLLLPSFGIGMVKRKLSGKPLLLDIDDWSTGLWLGEWNKSILKRFLETYYKNPFKLLDPATHIYKAWIEHFVSQADQITVTSNFLQQKFGGVKLPHAQDPLLFNPARFDQKKLKKEWLLADFKIIMFIGNPAPYKGIEQLIKAIKLTSRRDLRLVLVGINPRLKYSRQIIRQGGDSIIIKPNLISAFEVPIVLAMADLVVIPQLKTPATVGQIPAKLIDAMAMARPIIATKVSDMPEILDGCGIIVEPGDSNSLAEKISNLVADPAKAENLGRKARAKFLKNYTLAHLEDQLTKLFDKYL